MKKFSIRIRKPSSYMDLSRYIFIKLRNSGYIGNHSNQDIYLIHPNTFRGSLEKLTAPIITLYPLS